MTMAIKGSGGATRLAAAAWMQRTAAQGTAAREGTGSICGGESDGSEQRKPSEIIYGEQHDVR